LRSEQGSSKKLSECAAVFLPTVMLLQTLHQPTWSIMFSDAHHSAIRSVAAALSLLIEKVEPAAEGDIGW
jgi:hypothetical protein